MTETDLTNAKIAFYGRGRTNKEIAQSILDEWRKSQTIKDMIDAGKYFKCQNVTIETKTRDLPTGGNDTMSNVKIPSGFLRMNVMQKINYAWGKPPILGVNGPIEDTKDEAGNIIKDPLKDQYLALWQKWLNADRLKTIVRIATDSVNKGIGWAHITPIDGELEIQDFDSEQLYPAWADKAHTELDAIVWDYIMIEYINNDRKEIKKVVFWTQDAVEYYIDEDGTLKPDPDGPAMAAHMTRPVAGGEENLLWDRVPFIALKGTTDELPMLNVIRQNVDAYDKLNSKSVDALLDDIDPLLALEKYSPELGKLQEQRRIMQNARVVAVGEGGKVYYVQVKPDITAVQTKMQSIGEDIRRFGQSVMSQESDATSNPSGVALKFRYQDLDTYTNGFEVEAREFITKQLKHFLDIWWQFSGQGTVEQWAQYSVTFKFDRDMLINESSAIDDTVKLMATGISQQSVDNWNPAVESPEIEQQRREAEQNSGLANMAQQRLGVQNDGGQQQ